MLIDLESQVYYPFLNLNFHSPIMNISDIQSLMSNDVNANNQYIVEQLSSDVVLINQISQYIIHSGGKRLRPLLVLLIARAFNYDGRQHISAAAIIEFIHTATLLHDDVVDHSELRRGKETANNVFGNAASVLTGDFLYSRAFQIMIGLDSMTIMKILANATNKIAEGEVLQLLSCNNSEVDETSYMQVIYCKTAKLFEAACEVSGILSNASVKACTQLRKYGEHLGNAFQLTDDVMDFLSDAETMGKNVGDDLAEGKPTLPIIYAIKHSEGKEKAMLVHAIENGSTEHLTPITRIIKSSGAIDYTQEKALQEASLAKSAISFLPNSQYKQALIALCDISVHRLT
jgi:octaprenyl-diphosphate synthase